MEASIYQRQDAAQKFQQAALQQNISKAEIQQLTQDIMAGRRDAEIMEYYRRNPAQQPSGPTASAPASSPFTHGAPFGAGTPFGTPMQPMQMPGFPQMSMIMPQMSMGQMSMGPMPQPQMPQSQIPNQMPQNSIGQMFTQQIAPPPPQQSIPGMPGIPMIQMAQQGSANFSYSRSSSNPHGTSHFQMSHTSSHPTPMLQNQWPASAPLPHQAPSPAYIQAPLQPQAAIAYQQPSSVPTYQAPQPFPPPTLQAPPPAQTPLVYQAPPPAPVPGMMQPQSSLAEAPEQPPYHFHAHATASEPQSGRLSHAFQRQRGVEESYFSNPPGTPDGAMQEPPH